MEHPHTPCRSSSSSCEQSAALCLLACFSRRRQGARSPLGCAPQNPSARGSSQPLKPPHAHACFQCKAQEQKSRHLLQVDGRLDARPGRCHAWSSVDCRANPNQVLLGMYEYLVGEGSVSSMRGLSAQGTRLEGPARSSARVGLASLLHPSKWWWLRRGVVFAGNGSTFRHAAGVPQPLLCS